MHDEDDAAIVARCLQGQQAAWAVLSNRYQRLVYAIVMHMGLDEHMAADVFQTVFVRLVQHLPTLDDPSRLQAWIVTTAKREGLRQRERGRRTESMTRTGDDDEELADADFTDDSPIAEQRLEELQMLNRLRAGMDRLDERCRNLLLLVFRDEDERLPYDEVSRRLGVPVGSIGPTRSRCLDKLRRLVE
jgi:RNA polymerase sigma factor (sigma-70 family)